MPQFSRFPIKIEKGELSEQLSRSSGCIYITQYNTLRLRGNTPQKVFGKMSKSCFSLLQEAEML
jgi:hypothetical protein